MSVLHKWLMWAPFTAGDTFDPSTMMSLKWRDTTSDETKTIQYSTSSDMSSPSTAVSTSESISSDRVHTVILTGLTPSTTYYVQIPSDTGLVKFRTAPPKGYTGYMKWVFGADSRTNRGNRQAVSNRAMLEEPLFVVFPGDLVESGANDTLWKEWFEDYSNGASPNGGKWITPSGYMVPIMPGIGNHEGNTSEYEIFFEQPHYWYVQIANTVVIATNNGQPTPNDVMAAWTKEKIIQAYNDDSVRWIYLSYHTPAFPGRTSITGGEDNNMRKWFWPLMENWGGNATIVGHHHMIKISKPIINAFDAVAAGGKPVNDRLGIRELGDGRWGAPPSTPVNVESNWWYDSSLYSTAQASNLNFYTVEQN